MHCHREAIVHSVELQSIRWKPHAAYTMFFELWHVSVDRDSKLNCKCGRWTGLDVYLFNKDVTQ